VQLQPNPAPRRKRASSIPPDRSAPGVALNVLFFLSLAALLTAAVTVSLPQVRAMLNLPALTAQQAEPDPAEMTGLRILEAMSSNRAAYPDENGAFPDWVEVANTGVTEQNLEGFGLSDDAARVRFRFPDITLVPGQSIVVFCDGTEQVEAGKPLHARFKLSALGESVYLTNADGGLVQRVDVPPLAADESYALDSSGKSWTRMGASTPGYPNTEEGRAAFEAAAAQNGAPLQLNEIMASNSATVIDVSGMTPDYIEIHNRGGDAIDLSRFALSDDPANPVKWRFPQGAVIQPHGYYVVYCTGVSETAAYPPCASFRLAAEGETVLLSDLLGHVLDSVDFSNLRTDTALSRVSDGAAWSTAVPPTPGSGNQ